MSVHDAQATISCSEFAEWLAYFEMDPYGEVRADFRNAQLISAIARLVSGRDIQIMDLMPRFSEEESLVRQNDDVPAKLMAFVDIHNRRIRK